MICTRRRHHDMAGDPRADDSSRAGFFDQASKTTKRITTTMDLDWTTSTTATAIRPDVRSANQSKTAFDEAAFLFSTHAIRARRPGADVERPTGRSTSSLRIRMQPDDTLVRWSMVR